MHKRLAGATSIAIALTVCEVLIDREQEHLVIQSNNDLVLHMQYMGSTGTITGTMLSVKLSPCCKGLGH